MEKSKVYFCKEITPENIVKMFKALESNLPGKVAVKVHTGEAGNQNFLKPEFMKPIVEYVQGTIVENNTAYEGERTNTKDHLKVIENHGWSKYFEVDILDSEKPDLELEVPNGKILKQNFVGKHIANYNSMLVISHFKGHPMGGYGGALKQLSIGCASREGKMWIHTGGKTKEGLIGPDVAAEQNVFLEAMADAASSVVKHFGENIAFLNVMANLSVDCDCCAIAEDPCMKDIGILASIDPIAIDQACMDLVKKSDDPGKEHFLERVNSRNGMHTIDAAAELGFGTKEYVLLNIDL